MTKRIVLAITASVVLVIIAFMVPLWIFIGDFAVDRAQRQAVLEVQPLISSIAVIDEAQARTLVDAFITTSGHDTTLYYANGTILGTAVPENESVQLARIGGAFFTNEPDGRDLLVPVAGAPGGTAVLRVSIPNSDLYANVQRSRLIIVALALLLLGLAILVGLLLSRSFLRPMRALSAMAIRLSDGDLTARVTPSGPREIREIGGQLNQLATRVAELLNSEREAVADLAHRLRTPVTALRLNAESVADQEDRQRVEADVARLEVVVDEVIREARRPIREGAAARADAVAIVAERMRFWSVLAEDQNRHTMTKIAAEPVYVRVSPPDLVDAVDAIIGNVFSHTPEGCAYAVSIHPTSTGASIIVDDAGPGLESHAMIARGESGAGGTGLGLDIARRTAESSGGELFVGRSPMGGARIELALGAAAIV